MKKIIKAFFSIPAINRMYLKTLLKLHSLCYRLIGPAAIKYNQGTHPKHRIIKYEDWFLNHIDEKDVVFDIGCNKGYLCSYLSSKASKIIGIELDEKHVKQAKKDYTQNNIEFFHADATTFDYSIHNPNKLILSNVLEHIEHRVKFLRKLKDAVKSSNSVRILIRVPLIERDWLPVFKREMGFDYRLDPTHYTEYTLDEFKNEMMESGIQIVEHHITYGELYVIGKFNS